MVHLSINQLNRNIGPIYLLMATCATGAFSVSIPFSMDGTRRGICPKNDSEAIRYNNERYPSARRCSKSSLDLKDNLSSAPPFLQNGVCLTNPFEREHLAV